MVNHGYCWNPERPCQVHWEPLPTRRGTYNILSDCIFTILLCVYSCIHVNIPSHECKKWYQRPLVSKPIMCLVALLAPEVMIYIALQQWYWAYSLNVYMVERIGKLIPPKSSSDVEQVNDHMSYQKRHPWTRTHSHFAYMGGFVFEMDTSQSQKSFMPDSHTRLTLTPHALRKLADVEPMLIPDLSAQFIKDKSKANSLSKALACLQVCWFMLQAIARSYSTMGARPTAGLPISLLEYEILHYAAYCLIIYFAWWSKPLGVREPEVIKSESLKLHPGQMINGFHFITNKHKTFPPDPYMVIDPATLECLRLADLLRTDSATTTTWSFNWSDELLRPDHKAMLLTYINDFELLEALDQMSPKGSSRLQRFNGLDLFLAWALTMFIIIIYSALHIEAKKAPFATTAQRESWTASSAIILAIPFGSVFFIGYVSLIFDSIMHEQIREEVVIPSPTMIKIKDFLYYTKAGNKVLALMFLLWLAARLHILAECFVTFSLVDQDVYLVPVWSQYIPRFG